MVEFKVVGVYKHEEHGLEAQQFVLLRDESGRRLPVCVGQFESWQVSYALTEEPAERPLSAVLLMNVIHSFGAKVSEIELTLRDSTFVATIVLNGPVKTLRVDARASDAFALALYTDAPIMCDDTILAVVHHEQWPPAPQNP